MRGETSRSYENVYTKIEGVNPNKKGLEPKRRTKKNSFQDIWQRKRNEKLQLFKTSYPKSCMEK